MFVVPELNQSVRFCELKSPVMQSELHIITVAGSVFKSDIVPKSELEQSMPVFNKASSWWEKKKIRFVV